MRLFSTRFIELKNKHLMPLVNLELKSSDFEKYELKKLLINANFLEVNNLSANTYEFTFEKDILLKSILSEFEMFYSKSFIQESNLRYLNKEASLCWKVVTDYYKYFYYAVSLSRLVGKGNGFLDETSAKLLSSIITSLSGSVYKVDRGNYHYTIKSHPTDIQLLNLEISFNSRTSHESVWTIINEILKNMVISSSSGDEEKLILATLIQINIDYSANFMATLRNDVNYKAKYAAISLMDQISYAYLENITEEDFIRKISKYSKSNDESHKFHCFSLFGKYIEYLVKALYSDYLSRLNVNEVKKKTLQNLRNDFQKKRLII